MTRNTRRRLDTFSSPEDEHARSAVLLRFPCEQYHTGTTKLINTLWERCNIVADDKLVRIHGKAVSVSVGLFFLKKKKEPNVKTLLLDTRTTVSPFCCSKTTIIVRQSKSFED